MLDIIVTPFALLAAGLAAAAAYLALPAPLERLRATTDPALSRIREQLDGRPDAPSLARRSLWCGLAAAALCLLGVGWSGGPGLWCWAAWPVLTVTGVVGLGRLEPISARRRTHQLVLELPEALELMAACLAAGLPLRGACRAVAASFTGPVGDQLGELVRLVDLGTAEVDAWSRLARHPQLGPAADDVARAIDSGTLLAATLREHAAQARRARRAALVVRARAVGVRSVLPLMLCFIPAFLLLGVVPTIVSALSHALG